MILEWLPVYAIAALITGVLSAIVADDDRHTPAGGAPAVGVLAGLLWPLAWLAIVGWAVWRGGIGLGRSFSVLWDHTAGTAYDSWLDRRATRRQIPKATARKAGGL